MFECHLIAIVEDDDDIRLSIESLLQSYGFPVRGFPSAGSFLAELPLDAPSCLITDAQMPGMNGIELLRMVKAAREELPVIVITAYPDPTLRQHARSAGARGFLSKPFDEEALMSCLGQALGIEMLGN